jgi:DNA repair exonuclease SbcCD nuclease subunit
MLELEHRPLLKCLYVGDPHAEASSLHEMQKLIDMVTGIAQNNNVDRIILLGDQYHNHSLVHLQVMEFWERALKQLSLSARNVVALVGNHDKAGYANSKANAMMLHKNVITVDGSMEDANNLLYVGYQHNPEEFIRICKNSSQRTVICHQTLFGSKYENGFYAPQKDSIDPGDIPQSLIISGHIHTAQQFGKVWYPGSPRWRIATDANVEKYVYLVEHNYDGSMASRQEFSTKGACRPMYVLDDTEDNPLTLDNKHKDAKVIINVFGSVERVKRRKEEFEKLGHISRGFPVKNYRTDIKESDGVQKSFLKFVSTFKAQNGTAPERLIELSQRINWK